ncbi:hypothetical protein PoB_000335400 [Plakobranchus ocellatus]|uniref:Uncharacterized protein n=1 Tax=Plakobranchus ocellatus TaxID=259542 RepID=A0AAV3Y3P5_9GAST|nr:hypothetical protein PoB_000335400 [Plakobranchus ocellatus]
MSDRKSEDEYPGGLREPLVYSAVQGLSEPYQGLSTIDGNKASTQLKRTLQNQYSVTGVLSYVRIPEDDDTHASTSIYNGKNSSQGQFIVNGYDTF